MKLKDAIANINKSDIESEYEVEVFSNALGLSYNGYGDTDTISKRLKYVFLAKWLCTDTWVGTKVYFLDGVPVAVSYQSARKSNECVEFLSEQDVIRMRDFIFSLMVEDDSERILVCNTEKEIGDYYNVVYSGQLLVKDGFYHGQAVSVVKKYNVYADIKLWEYVDVSFNGEVITIPMSEFDIPFNVVSKS